MYVPTSQTTVLKNGIPCSLGFSYFQQVTDEIFSFVGRFLSFWFRSINPQYLKIHLAFEQIADIVSDIEKGTQPLYLVNLQRFVDVIITYFKSSPNLPEKTTTVSTTTTTTTTTTTSSMGGRRKRQAPVQHRQVNTVIEHVTQLMELNPLTDFDQIDFHNLRLKAIICNIQLESSAADIIAKLNGELFALIFHADNENVDSIREVLFV